MTTVHVWYEEFDVLGQQLIDEYEQSHTSSLLHSCVSLLWNGSLIIRLYPTWLLKDG